MKPAILLPLLGLVFSGPALFPIAQAGPIDICEHKCSNDAYPIIKTPRCDKACVLNPQPPGVDWVDCKFSYGSYACEVWPRGKDLSYSFDVSPGMGVSWHGPTYTPFVQVDCAGIGRGGTLSVTVTSPYGLSSHDWISLPCRTVIEQ